MRKLMFLIALALATTIYAGDIIGGVVNNGNLEDDDTMVAADSGDTWGTSIENSKHYIAADPTGSGGFDGWWLSRWGTYAGGNNTIGLITYGNSLATNGNMTAFANSGGIILTSDNYSRTIGTGDTFTLSFDYCSKTYTEASYAAFEIQASIIFDKGYPTEFTYDFAPTHNIPAGSTDGIGSFTGQYVTTESFSTVSVVVGARHTISSQGVAMDNVTLNHDMIGQATNPTPAHLAADLDSATISSIDWEVNPNAAISSITNYTVYFYGVPTVDATADPNFTDAGVVPQTVTTSNMNVTINTEFDYTYYWQVDTNYINTTSGAQTAEGDIWTFSTKGLNAVPVIVLPTALVTSVDMMPASIVPVEFTDLDPASFTWTLTPETEGMAVVDTSVDLANPTAEVTGDVPGTYTVTVVATDTASQTATDSMLVKIGADTCAAAQMTSAWGGFNSYDANEDCVVDLADYATFAKEWLKNVAIEGQIEE